MRKVDHSFSGCDRMSTDSSSVFQDCYDNVGCEVHPPPRPSISMNFIGSSGVSPTTFVDHLHYTNDLLLSQQKCEDNSFSHDKVVSRIINYTYK